MLVVFEILRKNYSTNALRLLFKHSNLVDLIILYITTIIISIFAFLFLTDPLIPFSINMVYLSIFLFIFSIIILFPLLFDIIESTTNLKEKKTNSPN